MNQKTSRLWGRSLFGRVLAVLGVVLGVSATALLVALPDESAGDVAAVEETLSINQPEQTAEPDAEPAQTEDGIDTDASSASAIEANPVSLLDELTSIAAPAPSGLLIESLDIDARVSPYGVNPSTGQMEVPSNVDEVAWYRFGPVPGEPGSAVLAAHVDLAGKGPGVFYRIRELSPGDRVRVTYTDKTERWFQVEARVNYEKHELPIETIFSRNGSPVLTLVTCGGGFNTTNRRYDSNVVVYAVPVNKIDQSKPADRA